MLVTAHRACSAVVAHVAEDHGLDVHSGAPPLRDIVQLPGGVAARVLFHGILSLTSPMPVLRAVDSPKAFLARLSVFMGSADAR